MTSTSNPKKLILLCTGLGRVQRGFERYIASLAEKLGEETTFSGKLEVWAGGRAIIPGVNVRRITNLYRNGILGKRLGRKAFLWEQRSFLVGMLPQLLKNKDAVFYLGEYQLYCYLFKIRQALGLDYSLVLYTGGQAIPGLFDSKRDFIHHVTNVYLAECRHIPANRQAVLPHFMEEDFEYDTSLQQVIRQRANGKKIVLSVGLIDREIKRMDLLIAALKPLAGEVFPVLLGQYSFDTTDLALQLESYFGKEGFVVATIVHSRLGDWYAVADLFVLCSPKESFGLAMVEALYHELPVICRDFPEARFVLQEHAVYAKDEELASWTAAIQNRLHPQSECKKAAGFVRERYTWQVLQPRYLAMFGMLLGLNSQAAYIGQEDILFTQRTTSS